MKLQVITFIAAIAISCAVAYPYVRETQLQKQLFCALHNICAQLFLPFTVWSVYCSDVCYRIFVCMHSIYNYAQLILSIQQVILLRAVLY